MVGLQLFNCSTVQYLRGALFQLVFERLLQLDRATSHATTTARECLLQQGVFGDEPGR